MSVLDICVILVITALAIVGAFRGFGRTLYDAIGLYGALWAADAAAFAFADSLHLSDEKGVGRALLFGACFLVLGVLALCLTRFIYGATAFHAGMFDQLLGLGAGIALGMVVMHAAVKAVAIADAGGNSSPVVLARGPVCDEILTFEGYHASLATITGESTHRRVLPDVGMK
jgi:uncharacterized membrane protein required for colicin V production